MIEKSIIIIPHYYCRFSHLYVKFTCINLNITNVVEFYVYCNSYWTDLVFWLKEIFCGYFLVFCKKEIWNFFGKTSFSV